MLFIRILKKIRSKWFYIINRNQFEYLASDAIIQSLLRIDGKQNISIRSKVTVQKMTWLAAVPLTNHEKCHLYIGEGSIIGNFNHIYATGELTIGKNVLTADKVYIADNQHEYEDISKPILSQPIKQFPPMHIGDGCWIGENVCILGVSIGKNCVIGANSVVTRAIPDYCIAVGAPAKVIKMFNQETKKWQKT